MFSCFVILILIMAGFYDDDDFSLSGLMQEGHDFVTVIESSSDDENYHRLLDCARQLAGESDKSCIEGASREVLCMLSWTKMSWKLCRICLFLKCLIVNYLPQTICHLLRLTQTS